MLKKKHYALIRNFNPIFGFTTRKKSLSQNIFISKNRKWFVNKKI